MVLLGVLTGQEGDVDDDDDDDDDEEEEEDLFSRIQGWTYKYEPVSSPRARFRSVSAAESTCSGHQPYPRVTPVR
jgi:hypothetical protein